MPITQEPESDTETTKSLAARQQDAVITSSAVSADQCIVEASLCVQHHKHLWQ